MGEDIYGLPSAGEVNDDEDFLKSSCSEGFLIRRLRGEDGAEFVDEGLLGEFDSEVSNRLGADIIRGETGVTGEGSDTVGN